MKKCKACQSEIDPKATKCPKCGADQRIWFARHPIWTILILLFVIGLFTSAANGNKGSGTNTSTNSSSSASTNTPSPTPAIAPFNIQVKSQIVKKVGTDTYRYWFYLKNNDIRDFNGDFWVQLYNGKEGGINWLILGGATSSLKDNPLKAGDFRYITLDDSHPPFQVSGIDGAGTFSYSFKSGDSEVGSGEGDISSDYEDLLKEFQQ